MTDSFDVVDEIRRLRQQVADLAKQVEELKDGAASAPSLPLVAKKAPKAETQRMV